MNGDMIDDDPVAVLQRWQDHGAVWRVLGRHADGVTIGLYTCSGGEEVDRFTSSDPRLLEWVNANNPDVF